MTMEDFEFETSLEEQAAPPGELSESGLDVPGPMGNEVDVPTSEAPEAEAGQDGVEAKAPPEEPPKKKRSSRKKADKAEDIPAVGEAADPAEDGGTPPMTEEVPPAEGLPEADQLDPEARNGAPENLIVMGLAEQASGSEPSAEPPMELEAGEPAAGMLSESAGDTPPEQPAAPERPRQAAPRPKAGRPAMVTARSCP